MKFAESARREDSNDEIMGKILFIRGGAIGDFILTLPAIELVRSSFPDVEIDILGYESIATLAVEAGLADRVRSIEHASLAPFFAPGAPLEPDLCAFFASFDVVVSYLYDPDGIFQANLERAGVETLLTGPYRMNEAPPFIHSAHQLALPLEQLALFLEDPFVELSYGPVEPGAVAQVAVHPGSGSPSKNWSLENWAEIVRRLACHHPGLEILVIAGEAEAETAPIFGGLLEKLGIRHDFARDRSLGEIARLLSSARLFLGHDTGIAHLAASTGRPGIAVFGPTNPEIWAPRHPEFSVVQAPAGDLSALSPDLFWSDAAFTQKRSNLE